MSVASLGMYDHPAQRDANDTLWTAIARRLRADGIDAPRALDRTRPVEAIWRDKGLLLAQACGFPLANDPALALSVVAVPSYAVPGCTAGRHFSHLVVREDDAHRTLSTFVGRRAAINTPASNSGCNLLRLAMAAVTNDPRPFAAAIETGSHRASAAAVRDGGADIAAIDAVTWAALERYEPAAVTGLRLLAPTPSSPALPFVTAAATGTAVLAQLRTALAEALAEPSLADARDTLFLAAIGPAPADLYTPLRRQSHSIASG